MHIDQNPVVEVKKKNPPGIPLFNRELGILAFNERVLAQAADEGIPLLERLRFVCFVSSNLDEFFEIRFAGLVEQAINDHEAPMDAVIQQLCRPLLSRRKQRRHVAGRDAVAKFDENLPSVVENTDWAPVGLVAR